jgi:hypothetical protein
MEYIFSGKSESWKDPFEVSFEVETESIPVQVEIVAGTTV